MSKNAYARSSCCPSCNPPTGEYTGMADFTFVCPNSRGQPRSKRIPNEIWELYRADIAREFLFGGGKGYAQALRWIKEKKIPDFDPSLRQLSHRIKGVWSEDFLTGTDFNASLDNNDLPRGNLKCHTLAFVNGDARRDGDECFPDSHHGDEEPRQKNAGVSLVCSARIEREEIKGEAVASYRDGGVKGPEMDEREGDSKTKIITPKAELEDLTAIKALERMPAEEAQMSKDSSVDSCGLLTPETSDAEITCLSPVVYPVGVKRRVQVAHSISDVSSKRIKHEATGFETKSPGSPGKPMAQDAISHYSDIKSTLLSLKALKVSKLLDDLIDESAPFEKGHESVLAPDKVQDILIKIGIEWDLAMITQCLRKDVVFHTFLPTSDNSSPIEALKTHIKRLRSFAELYFVTADFHGAFPLFLLIWITLQDGTAEQRVFCLIQCARCAKRQEDKELVVSLLRASLWVFDSTLPQHIVIRSLLRLEISKLSPPYESKEDCKNLYLDGICLISTNQSSLVEVFDRIERQLQASQWFSGNGIEPYHLSRKIISRVLDDLTKPAEDDEEHYLCRGGIGPDFILRYDYTLSDVLLADILLGYDHDSTAVTSSIQHLRKCLNHAKAILGRQICKHSYQDVRAEECTRLPGFPNTIESAVFLRLLLHWSPTASCKYLDIGHENCLLGLSTLNIILVTSGLVCEGYDIFVTHDRDPLREYGIGNRLADLIAFSDETLLLSFQWSSVRRNRKLSEDVSPTEPNKSWNNWIIEVHNLIKSGISEDQVICDPDPPMAMSVMTTSTLSDMREYSREITVSHNCGSSPRSRSPIQPVEVPQWISHIADTFSMENIPEDMAEFTISGNISTAAIEPLQLETLDWDITAGDETLPGGHEVVHPVCDDSRIEKEIETVIKREIMDEDSTPEDPVIEIVRTFEIQPRDGG